MSGYQVVELILMPLITLIVGIITAFIASNGFWSHKLAKSKKKDASAQLLLGLAHTRLMALCTEYIDRGWITPQEYEDLMTYLYEPYVEMGGNGMVKRMMEEQIARLPIRQIDDKGEHHGSTC